MFVFLALPGAVKAVHAAVCDGGIEEDNLLPVQTFNPASTITRSVPSGMGGIFMVRGEGFSGLADCCGVSAPADIDGGSNDMVAVAPFNPTCTLGNSTFSRNAIPGAAE